MNPGNHLSRLVSFSHISNFTPNAFSMKEGLLDKMDLALTSAASHQSL